ncbi:hypothetical protein [Desulfofundulus sp.]|uniref:hypothetical protein n=1 Tax=Desulfofundulus sp. TaxID=2282750 RepID=UPI003C767BEC
MALVTAIPELLAVARVAKSVVVNAREVLRNANGHFYLDHYTVDMGYMVALQQALIALEEKLDLSRYAGGRVVP